MQKNLDVVMLMHNLIEYSNNYSKISGNVWWYYRDQLNATLTESESFKCNVKITGKTSDNGNTKDVKTTVPLKYSINFRRILN